MALAGFKGGLTFQREQPDPILIPAAAVQAGSDRLVVETDDLWPMDPVTLVHSGGTINGFYHRNELDRARLHSDAPGALNGTDETVVDLNSVSGDVILAHSPTSAQLAILEDVLAELDPLTAERRLRSLPASRAAYVNEAPATAYSALGTLTMWRLSMSGPEIDTTSLGDRWGDAVKAAITGTGTMDFIVDLFHEAETLDSDPLLRAVLLTGEGSTAAARFILREPGEAAPVCESSGRTMLTRGLWYEATILITASDVTVNAADQIVGSANFVTIGRVALRT